jgi:VanZ family protein
MKYRKVILITITIGWMILIFNFSNQKSTISTNVSNSFMDNTIVNIFKMFNNDITSEKINLIKTYFFLPTRKIAHIAVYFILAILVMYTLKEFKVKDILYYSLLICYLYALSDEFHQLFVIGRSGEFKDVIIDTLGSILAIIIFKNKMKSVPIYNLK